jgi:tape measure domain-containing protein
VTSRTSHELRYVVAGDAESLNATLKGAERDLKRYGQVAERLGKTKLAAVLDRRGFVAYEDAVKRANERKVAKAQLGANFNASAFRAYQRALGEAGAGTRAFQAVGRKQAENARAIGQGFRFAATSAAAFATLGLAAAVKGGVQFNATMEQNRAALKLFLGSTKEADKFLGQLFQTAKKTPFQFTDITNAAKKFLAFGFTAKETKKSLDAIGNSVAALGGGQEKIDRITIALGQIKAKGRLQGDELLQLAEAGIPAYQILKEKLHLTADEVKNIGRQGIDAQTAINALTTGMQERYGRAAAVQSRTFTGQISTLKDNTAQALGAMTQGLFKELRKWLPMVNATVVSIGTIFKRKDLSLGEKLAKSLDTAKIHLAPIFRDLKRQIDKAHLAELLGKALSKGAEKVAEGAGRLAVLAARSFVTAFRSSDAIGKLALGAFLVSKLVGWQTIFAGIGKKAGGALLGAIKDRLVKGKGAEVVADALSGGKPKLGGMAGGCCCSGPGGKEPKNGPTPVPGGKEPHTPGAPVSTARTLRTAGAIGLALAGSAAAGAPGVTNTPGNKLNAFAHGSDPTNLAAGVLNGIFGTHLKGLTGYILPGVKRATNPVTGRTFDPDASPGNVAQSVVGRRPPAHIIQHNGRATDLGGPNPFKSISGEIGGFISDATRGVGATKKLKGGLKDLKDEAGRTAKVKALRSDIIALSDKLSHLRKGSDDYKDTAGRLRKKVAELGDATDGVGPKADSTRRKLAKLGDASDGLGGKSKTAGRKLGILAGNAVGLGQTVNSAAGSIATVVNDLLGEFGAKKIKFVAKGLGKTALAGARSLFGFAQGGVIPVGFGRQDNYTLVDPRGQAVAAMGGDEGILTRHQMPWADLGLAVAKSQGISPYGSLDELWQGERKPNYYAKGGALKRYAKGGNIVPIPGQPGESINSSILRDVLSLVRRYHLRVTDGYAASGHAPNSDHKRGMAIDVVPGPGGSWDLVDKLAHFAEPSQNHPRYPFRWVGYNGDANHGRGNHLHLSWLPGAHLGAMAAGLKRIVLKGPDGALKTIGQGALDRMRKGGNAFVDKKTGEIGGGDLPGGKGHYSKAQLKRLWVKAGGDPRMANLMAAIALAESGGDANIVNGIGATGLWQIHPGGAKYKDPLTNARTAVHKLRTQGLKAWEAYTNGNYRHYLARGGRLRRFGKGGGLGGPRSKTTGSFTFNPFTGHYENMSTEQRHALQQRWYSKHPGQRMPSGPKKGSKAPEASSGRNPITNQIERHTPDEWKRIRDRAAQQREAQKRRDQKLTRSSEHRVAGIVRGSLRFEGRAQEQIDDTDLRVQGLDERYSHDQRVFDLSRDDLTTDTGRAARTREIGRLKYDKTLSALAVQRQRRLVQAQARGYKKAIRGLKGELKHKLPKARRKAVQSQLKGYVTKYRELRRQAKSLGITLDDIGLDIQELDQGLADDLKQGHADQIQNDLDLVDLKERAGTITAEDAAAQRHQIRTNALGGAYGDLDERQRLQIMGDDKEAQDAATAATNALADEIKAMREELETQRKMGESIMATDLATVWRALGDLMSGQIAATGYAPRAQTAGDGSVLRY